MVWNKVRGINGIHCIFKFKPTAYHMSYQAPFTEEVREVFLYEAKTSGVLTVKRVVNELIKKGKYNKEFVELLERDVTAELKKHKANWLGELAYQPKEYFSGPVFNEVSEPQTVTFRKVVKNWGLYANKLTPYQQESRNRHPRAYEPWKDEEVELLQHLLDLTNDAEYISQVLGRSENSIITAGDRLILKKHYGKVKFNYKVLNIARAKKTELINQDEPKDVIPVPSPQGPQIEGLNTEQSSAVLNAGKRLLVLAGAGSGKTRTLIQKIQYLIEEQGVNAKDILAITYTKNAASEMLDRLIIMEDATGEFEKALEDKKVSKSRLNELRRSFKKQVPWLNSLTLTTFHGFCYQILRKHGAKQYDNQFKVLTNEKFQESTFKHGAKERPIEILNRQIIQLCTNPAYLLRFKRYLLDYHVKSSKKKPGGHETIQERGKNYISLNGTQVRSKSERYIADWFYRHGIKFEYEPKINLEEYQFYPDFYLPEANIFLEHVSKLSKGTKTKIREFEHAGRTCVTTYESQLKDTRSFNGILENLIRQRLDSSFEWEEGAQLNYEEEFSSYQKEVRKFLDKALQVWNMIRVEGKSFDEIFQKAYNDPHERVRDFYQLIKPLLEGYSEYCTNKSYLDFNEMILQSMLLLEEDPKTLSLLRSKYKYVLIDEFQDVNNLQVRLVKKLLAENTQLFCVGDDWQSIYGFRGANVDYTVNFSSHFEGAEIIKLTKNYRSAPSIVEAGNHVISYNENKVEKSVEAWKGDKTKIHLYSGRDIPDNVEYVADAIRQLYEKGYQKDDVLILHRRSQDYAHYAKYFESADVSVRHSTIHGAKGLEAKAVFIIGLHDLQGGFPEIWSTDRIFQLIKRSDEKALMEEERRLFYVAITRAMNELFLLSIKGSESNFISEIPSEYITRSNKRALLKQQHIYQCPSCHEFSDDNVNFCPNCGAAKE